MDAGVPIHAPVAGIAMGMIKEGDEIRILSDILGDEDHLGDMDFKVAGTASGVTALQMDIKINGITAEIMKVALDQAKAGRLHILGEMNKVLDKTRPEMSEWAPTIITISPVTSAGNRTRRRCTRRENAISNSPTSAVIPNTSDRPPVFAARIEALRKEGPHSCGQR